MMDDDVKDDDDNDGHRARSGRRRRDANAVRARPLGEGASERHRRNATKSAREME